MDPEAPGFKKQSLANFLTQPLAAGVFIFLTAFLARVIFYLVLREKNPMWGLNSIGINGWLEIARSWASGRGYSEHKLLTYFPVPHAVPTAARSPLPVLVLSGILRLFGDRYYDALFVCSWELSSLTAAALYFLCGKVLGSRKLGGATALLYCFYLPEMSISTGYAAASESLFTFLLVCYFLAVIRQIETKNLFWAAAAGFLVAAAGLTRPVVLFFPVLYGGWMIHCRRGRILPSLALYLAVFFLVLSPWVIRNQKVFHKPVFATTLGGYNLLRHNFMIEQNEFYLATAERFEPEARRAAARAGSELERLNEAELDRIFMREAFSILRKYPLRYLKLCGIRAVWLWYKIQGEHPLFLIQNILIYLLMFPGFVLVFVKRPVFLRGIVLHIFYFVLVHVAVNSQFRFISPMMPYGIMTAVYTGGFLWQRFRSRFGPKSQTGKEGEKRPGF